MDSDLQKLARSCLETAKDEMKANNEITSFVLLLNSPTHPNSVLLIENQGSEVMDFHKHAQIVVSEMARRMVDHYKFTHAVVVSDSCVVPNVSDEALMVLSSIRSMFDIPLATACKMVHQSYYEAIMVWVQSLTTSIVLEAHYEQKDDVVTFTETTEQVPFEPRRDQNIMWLMPDPVQTTVKDRPTHSHKPRVRGQHN